MLSGDGEEWSLAQATQEDFILLQRGEGEDDYNI
jgi:hypothetical protein